MFYEAILKKSCCFPDGGALTIRVGEKIILDVGSFISNIPKEEQLKVTDIFLTHAHLDHVKDLPFLAESLFGVFRQTIRVFATATTINNLKSHLFNGKIWPDFTKLPDKKRPVFDFHELHPLKELTAGEFRITAVPVNHCDGAVGYIVSGKEGNVAITGDTGPTDKLWSLINGLTGETAVFIETSFPDRLKEVAESAMHLTPSLLKGELEKIKSRSARVIIYHIKNPYREEIINEIKMLGDKRVTILGE